LAFWPLGQWDTILDAKRIDEIYFKCEVILTICNIPVLLQLPSFFRRTKLLIFVKSHVESKKVFYRGGTSICYVIILGESSSVLSCVTGGIQKSKFCVT
jgi:hypothetical protein